MRRKQLFAIILAGALAAGSAPAAVFAAESDMAAMSEEGAGDAGSEEAGSEDGSSDAEAPVTDGGDAADALIHLQQIIQLPMKHRQRTIPERLRHRRQKLQLQQIRHCQKKFRHRSRRKRIKKWIRRKVRAQKL